MKAPVLSSKKHQKDGSRSEGVIRRSLRDSSREGACALFRKASEGWFQIRRPVRSSLRPFRTLCETAAVKAPVLSSEKHQKDGSSSEGISEVLCETAAVSSRRLCSLQKSIRRMVPDQKALSEVPCETAAVKAPVLSSEEHQKDGSRSEGIIRSSLRDSNREGACALFRKASEEWLQI